MTRTEIRVEILKGNLSKAKTDEALNYLHRLKLALFVTETKEGHPTERWFATPLGAVKRLKSLKRTLHKFKTPGGT